MEVILSGISAGIDVMMEPPPWLSSEKDEWYESSASEIKDIRISRPKYDDGDEMGSPPGNCSDSSMWESVGVTFEE